MYTVQDAEHKRNQALATIKRFQPIIARVLELQDVVAECDAIIDAANLEKNMILSEQEAQTQRKRLEREQQKEANTIAQVNPL